MSSQLQIVFRGELLDGFELAAVKESAGRRLKAAPEQVERLFSGKRAILKKGLSDETAQRYASELQRIGMRVTIEPEAVKVISTTSASADPIGRIDPIFTPAPVRNEPQRVTSRDEPAFDPQKTQLSLVPEDDLPPPPERWSQPTIAVSQRHLSSMLPDVGAATSSADAPTMIVPPRNSASSEPTVVVTRGSASGSSSSHVSTPNISSSFAPTIRMPVRSTSEASAPTMIVPPRHSAASEPTMIVPPRSTTSYAASEPTMIVPPRHSAASEPTMIVPPRNASASQPTIIVRSNDKLPSFARPTDEPFDTEKTQLAHTKAIEDYLSPVSDEQLEKATAAFNSPTPAAADEPEVQCPTCGDKQPKRVYCRRCGHALQLPPKQPSGESTVTITKRPFPRPPLTPQPAAPAVSEETILVDDDTPEGQIKSAAGDGSLAAPTWLTIVVLFVILLATACWLIFS